MCIYYVWCLLAVVVAMFMLMLLLCCGKECACYGARFASTLWDEKLTNGLAEMIPQAIALWLTTFYNYGM